MRYLDDSDAGVGKQVADRGWFWFRGLPFWGQVVGWVLLFWVLIPFLIWRTTWGKETKVIATGVFVLVLALVATTDPALLPASDRASDTRVSRDEIEPESDDQVDPDDDATDQGSDAAGSQASGGSSSVDADEKARPPRPRSFLVTRVVDGDTIEVRIGSRIEDIRLIGIDTPETVHPTVGVECFGRAASNFTKDRLEGERVRLEYDVERRDRYGRLLAYVWLDGTMFNRALVARGFASVFTYPPNVRYVDRFLQAQRSARSTNKGLWGGCVAGVEPETQEKPAPASGVAGRCDPNYSGACIPPYPPDFDCTEVGATNFSSTGSDPHGFDGDGDGIACES